MLQSHQFTGNRQFSAEGRFLLYQECSTYGVSTRVSIYLDGQPVARLFPGDWVELDEPATRWEVFPDSPSCSGVIVIGNGTIRSLRTLGQMETADRSLSAAVAGSQIIAGTQRTAAASLFACIGLVSTVERLAVRSLRVVSSGSATVRVYRATGGASVPLSTRAASNKVSSGAASSTAIQTFDSASASPVIAGVSAFEQLDECSYMLSRETQYVASAPIILLPGESLWAVQQVAAGQISAAFEAERL